MITDEMTEAGADVILEMSGLVRPTSLAREVYEAMTRVKMETTDIVVTDSMIDAGLEAIREHHYGDDLRYMLESVFRAMAYNSPTNPSAESPP